MENKTVTPIVWLLCYLWCFAFLNPPMAKSEQRAFKKQANWYLSRPKKKKINFILEFSIAFSIAETVMQHPKLTISAAHENKSRRIHHPKYAFGRQKWNLWNFVCSQYTAISSSLLKSATFLLKVTQKWTKKCLLTQIRYSRKQTGGEKKKAWTQNCKTSSECSRP